MSNRLSGRPRLSVSIGQRFGRLTVLRRGPSNKAKEICWWCACDCDRMCTLVSIYSLVRKGTSSCGCLQKETATKHGLYRSAEYRIWSGMRSRCNNPKDTRYARYGQRGIKVCPRWEQFLEFYQDMGPRPTPQHSIERLDVSGDYNSENCIWADRKTQARNKTNSIRVMIQSRNVNVADWAEESGINASTLRSRHYAGPEKGLAMDSPVEARVDRKQVLHQGRTLSLAKWATETGIPYSTLYSRLFVNEWTTERAFNTPARRKTHSKKPRPIGRGLCPITGALTISV